MFNFPLLSSPLLFSPSTGNITLKLSEECQLSSIKLKPIIMTTSCCWRRYQGLMEMDALISSLLLCSAVVHLVKIHLSSGFMVSQWCYFGMSFILAGICTCILSVFRETDARKTVFIKQCLHLGLGCLQQQQQTSITSTLKQVCCLRWNVERLSRAQ